MIGFRRKQAAPTQRDWYYDADPAEKREYDAFGPWISAIRTNEEMPPRFRHVYEELRSSTFLFKIPVNADRRAMRPGMDLYRAVLAIDADRVVMLEWNGSAVSRYEAALASIKAVRIDQDLLSARFSLLLADGQTVSLGYNAVSSKEIEGIVTFLRGRIQPGTTRTSPNRATIAATPGNEINDHFYLSMWQSYFRHAPAARVLYWEPPGIRCGRLKSSLGCLLLDGNGELVIINRGRFVRRWLEAVYSDAVLYVPWTSIQAVEQFQKAAGRKSSIPTVRLTLPEHTIDLELYAPSDNIQRLLTEVSSRINR